MTGKAEADGLMRKAVLAALGYIAIMAVGMFTAGHVYGITYGDPAMVNVLVFFELAMSVYAVIVARRLFGHWHCGFGPIDWSGMWWMAPAFLVIAALFAAAVLTGTPGVSLLVITVIVTMCLVGFSEELMFRGIVLKGSLSAVSRGKAILISSALFSSLHAVNVLAFVPLDGMVQQLILTFIFGLAMACYALRVNSLVPVIVFHTLWDLVQFLGILWGSDFGSLIMIGVVVNAIGGAALWWLVLRRGKG